MIRVLNICRTLLLIGSNLILVMYSESVSDISQLALRYFMIVWSLSKWSKYTAIISQLGIR